MTLLPEFVMVSIGCIVAWAVQIPPNSTATASLVLSAEEAIDIQYLLVGAPVSVQLVRVLQFV